MCSSHGDSAATAGLPHSEIHGSAPAFGSPWHIADRCVLRRLLVPRHSPCTLCSLTCDLSFFTRRKCRFTLFGSFLFTSCFALHFLLCSVFKVHLRDFSPLVGSSGFEPPTSRLSGARSNQLSYEPVLVEMNGIEPMTPCLQSRCSPS